MRSKLKTEDKRGSNQYDANYLPFALKLVVGLTLLRERGECEREHGGRKERMMNE